MGLSLRLSTQASLPRDGQVCWEENVAFRGLIYFGQEVNTSSHSPTQVARCGRGGPPVPGGSGQVPVPSFCSVLQHSFDGILQWAIQSMSRPLAEAPTFPS